MSGRRKLPTRELSPTIDDVEDFSSDEDDGGDYEASSLQEPEIADVSPLHAIFMATFYGGFGFLSVFRLTWIMCFFMNFVTDPLHLDRVETILERDDAQRMMRLVGLPFCGLAIYYLRQRDDAYFLRSTVYGRLGAGGVGVASAIAIFGTLPSACWLIWCADVFPALILLWALGDRGKDVVTGAIHPGHGLWGALFYFTFGFLGASRHMGLLVDVAALFKAPGQETTLRDLVMPDGAQGVMRLSGLPLCALGFYYFRHRGDREFMLSSVYSRLLIGGLGLFTEVLIFRTLSSACWFLWVLDVVPALICWRALRNAGQCGCFMAKEGRHESLNEEVESDFSGSA